MRFNSIEPDNDRAGAASLLSTALVGALSAKTGLGHGITQFLLLIATVCGALAESAPLSGPLNDSQALIQSVSLSKPTGTTGPLFESLAASQTGIHLVYRFPTAAPFQFLQDQGCATGVAIGDVDGDGKPDLYLTRYNQGDQLYRNLGDWHFEDVTARAGVTGDGRWHAGATFIDIDRDGDLDLYVCVFDGPNQLYVNQGDGTFKEQASAFGLDFSGASVMMAFADYDGDGELDGYLATHRLNVGMDHLLPRSSQDAFRRSILRVTGRGQAAVEPAYAELFALMSRGQGRTELVIAGQQDYLYHHHARNHLNVVNDRAGIHGNDIGLAAHWWDYNQDGRPDLYVSNDYKGPDRLYRNNGDGTFTETTRSALPHIPWSSMGSDSADLNNDGRIDFMATDMAGSTRARRAFINGDLSKESWFLTVSEPPQCRRNAVYLSTGTEHVLEVAYLTGLEATDWTWSPKFADFDNDGWVDLFIANGMSRDFMDADAMAQTKDRAHRGWRSAPILREQNLAFRNLGDLQFLEVGQKWGLDHRSASFGAAIGDLDGDGNLDLIVSNFDEPVSVYRNRGANRHRARVRLKGTVSNSWGIGAQITIRTSAGVQTRTLNATSGMMSANEPVAHFGLGPEEWIDQLEIQWPSGRKQRFAHLEADRFYTVTEPSETPVPPAVPALRPWFVPGAPVAGFRHVESDFDDFQREPLLPWKLSRLGPGMAVGDVNGDGIDDFYLGGAAGQAGMLCLSMGQGRFQRVPMACFEEDRAAEDMAALFFDADGDGDLDLYVVSGGVECRAGDPVLRDRLYLNDGHGRLTRAPQGALPDLRDSGSCVVAADLDRDGDLDLFVGARCVPGHYPRTPQSRLLRNHRGSFEDVTDLLAPGLKEIGLVTSAIWSDADGDGWPDLLITQEWGRLALFLNRHGRLTEAAGQAQLQDRTGFWNGIAARDLDGDGDIDYVVTNLGLNTPYRATPTQPVVAFAIAGEEGDRFIEAAYDGSTLYPVRGRQTMLSIWPALVEKFPSFRSYATAALEDVIPRSSLAHARRWQVTTLESGVFLNDGHARFQFVPLPRLAQVAPGFGVVATELDGDGKPDIYLVHNFFSPQPETGRFDGGLSQLLPGRGDGTFALADQAASGLIVPQDAKSLALTDLDDDGRPDLLIGVNNGELLAFLNRTPATNRFLRVRLRGQPGNPSAVGARVTVQLDNRTSQTAEVAAGGGYLSQSTADLYFGLGATNVVDSVVVRWPDGSSSSTKPGPAEGSLTISEGQK